MINQMTIIGLDFIGQSVAQALKPTQFANTIVGFDDRLNESQYLLKEGLINQFATDIISAVKKADLIIITSPFEQYKVIFDALAKHIKPKTIIIDMASLKVPVIQLARMHLGQNLCHFIPSHPLINPNKIITQSASPDLFAEKSVVVTKIAETDPSSLLTAIHFWEKMGAMIEYKTAEENDAILALVSHLPQILAFTFINSLDNDKEALKYISSNFIDFTRIATQCPLAWSRICLANREAILKELNKFEARLKKIKKMLEADDTTLFAHFNNAKELRESLT